MEGQKMNELNPHQTFGLVPRQVAASMSGLEFLQGLLDRAHPAPPFSEVADIWPVSLEPGRVTFEAMPSARFYNPMGTVHGGWIAILLDTAMGCAVHSTLKAGQAYTTLEMKTVFTRPVFETTGKLRCEGVLLHAGGRVASSEGKVFDAAGRLVAHGSETCLIMDIDGRRAGSDKPTNGATA
jgi:uncharacterized protein (TIGR00369 family)